MNGIGFSPRREVALYTMGVSTMAVASSDRTALTKQPTTNTRANSRHTRPPPAQTAKDADQSKKPALSAMAERNIIPTSSASGSAVSDNMSTACKGETKPVIRTTPPPRAAHHARLRPHGRASTRLRVRASIVLASNVPPTQRAVLRLRRVVPGTRPSLAMGLWFPLLVLDAFESLGDEALWIFWGGPPSVALDSLVQCSPE